MCGSWVRMATIVIYNWMLGSQMVELLKKESELWSCVRNWFLGQSGFGFSKADAIPMSLFFL